MDLLSRGTRGWLTRGISEMGLRAGDRSIVLVRPQGLDVAVNEAGTLLASAGQDSFVRVWSVADRSLVTEISFDVDGIANVEFIDDAHLFVMPRFGKEAIVITLDAGELLDLARSRLTRSFTAEECATFGIDPCPTLDEVKGG